MYKLFKINGNTQNFPEFEQFHSLSKEFLPFAQKSLGFDKPVSVNLLSDPQNAKNPLGKTAYYEPEQMKITLFVDKRHVKDILRSMAHELVHHTQNCRGEFKNGFQTGEGYAQEDGHMREMEREAYEKGQMMLRDFEDTRKKKKTQALEEEVAHILKPRPGVVKAACQALNNPKNIERRRSLPDRGVAEIGGTLKQSVNVKSFEHAYQMAQCHRADTFKYRGYKGKKFVNDEFSTDLYDVDPTRGVSDEHFDQMHKAYDRSIRNLEESTLKENQEMSRVNEKFPDLTGDGKVTQADILKGRGVSLDGKKEEQEEAKEKHPACPKCKEKHAVKEMCGDPAKHESLQEDDWIKNCRVEKGERGYAWANSTWKNKDCLLKKANAGLEDWQKWEHESGEQGNSITIVQKKTKDGEGVRSMTIHWQAGGSSPQSSDEEAKNESRDWKKANKDQMLFEALVKRWVK